MSRAGFSSLLFVSCVLVAALPQVCAQENLEASQDPAATDRLNRRLLVTSSEPLVRATAIVVFEPELRSAPVVEAPEALTAIIPHVVERPTTVERLPGEAWQITVILRPGDLKAKAKLTVVSITETGKSIVSPVQWVMPDKSAQNLGQMAEVRCDQAQASTPLQRLLSRSVAHLRELAEVRRQRRRLLEELLRERLTTQAVEKLSALEAQMNIVTGSSEQRVPLSRSIALDELMDRLIALQAFRDSPGRPRP